MICTPLKIVLVGSAAAAATVFAFSNPCSGPALSTEGAAASAPAPAIAPAIAPDRRLEIPLAFEENRGQADAGVQFIGRGRHFTARFSGEGVALALQVPATDGEMNPVKGRRFGVVGAGMRLVGARGDLRLEAGAPLAGRVNYLKGDNPSKHITGIPTFSSVRGDDAWPGIDVGYTSAGPSFEYSFEIAPGADAGTIALEFPGTDGLALQETGTLTMATPGGILSHGRPVAWQERDGAREPVEVAFALRGEDRVGFDLGAHDASRTVFIDPTVDYSLYHGGQGNDYGWGVAVDGSGAALIGGTTYDNAGTQDFPVEPATIGTVNDLTNSGLFTGTTSDVFITKLDSSGTHIWTTLIGGDNGVYDECYCIALDSSGNPYVGGYTDPGSNYPVSATPFDGTNGGGGDGIVSSVDGATGATLLYSTFVGGSSLDYVNGIKLDSVGNIHVVGSTSSSTFTNSVNTYKGAGDGFYAAMNTGNTLAFMTFVGGSALDSLADLAIDATGKVFVCGSTKSSNFSQSSSLAGATFGGTEDAIIRIYSSSQTLLASTFLNTTGKLATGTDGAGAIAIDSNGDAWVTGFTNSTNFPLATPVQSTKTGSSDAFLTRIHFDAAASPKTTITYSTYIGGSLAEFATGVGVDTDGVVTVVGQTQSTNLPVFSSEQDVLTGNAGVDAFLFRIRPTVGFNYVLTSTYFGGSTGGAGNYDVAQGVAVTPAGDVVMLGWGNSTDIPSATNTNSGGDDAFVTRFTYESVDFIPYWGHLTDAIAAGDDTLKIRSYYDYSNRSPGLFDINDDMVVTVTPAASGALTLDTATGIGSWKTTTNNLGDTIYTWGGKDASNRKWKVIVNEDKQTFEAYVADIDFTGLLTAPYKVGVEVAWSGNTALFTINFRNSVTFNALKQNGVLRKP